MERYSHLPTVTELPLTEAGLPGERPMLFPIVITLSLSLQSYPPPEFLSKAHQGQTRNPDACLSLVPQRQGRQFCEQPRPQRSRPRSHWSLATALSQPIPTSFIDPGSHLPVPIPRLLSRASKESPHHHAVSDPVNPDCISDSPGGF